MTTETKSDPASSPARLLAALVAYWVGGGLILAVMVEMGDMAMTRGVVAVVVSALLVTPAAVLLALKTDRHQKLKPAVQVIFSLAAAGMISTIVVDVTSRLGIAIVCVSYPAFWFGAVWLGPEGSRARAI